MNVELILGDMTRNRPPGKGKKTGPKVKHDFTNWQLEMVELLTKLSATDVQLAIFFNVSEATISNWKNKHPEFMEARVRGGIEADAKVVKALFNRAVGYEYEEKELIRAKTGDFITKVSQKKLPPDVKAIIHWLRIRQREAWSVVDEMRIGHNHSGKIEHIHNSLKDIPVNELSKESKDLLFEITAKTLSNANRDN